MSSNNVVRFTPKGAKMFRLGVVTAVNGKDLEVFDLEAKKSRLIPSNIAFPVHDRKLARECRKAMAS